MTDFDNTERSGETVQPEASATTENRPEPTTAEAPDEQAAQQPAAETLSGETPAQSAPAAAVPASPEAPAGGAGAAPAAEVAPSPATYVPRLTLEPDPVPPEDPVPQTNIPGSAAGAFHMPDPPRAPEPPRSEPAYQQAPPSYGSAPQYNAPPQYGNQPYGAPQYQAPQYGQSPQQSYYPPQYNAPPMGYVQKSRLAAGLLALMFGFLGVHNFYLGYNTKGTIQLIVSLVGGIITCGMATVAMIVWAFIEGILILSCNNSHLYDGNGVILRD